MLIAPNSPLFTNDKWQRDHYAAIHPAAGASVGLKIGLANIAGGKNAGFITFPPGKRLLN